MYNSFVFLRKDCLNGVVNMAADFSVSEATFLDSATDMKEITTYRSAEYSI